MEHTMQHTTLSLNEEKGFMREIKQLKQLREQISSSMGTKDEVKQALDEKEKTEERLKVHYSLNVLAVIFYVLSAFSYYPFSLYFDSTYLSVQVHLFHLFA